MEQTAGDLIKQVNRIGARILSKRGIGPAGGDIPKSVKSVGIVNKGYTGRYHIISLLCDI